MNKEKLITEIDTLKKFFTIYCHGNKHNGIKMQNTNVTFQKELYTNEIEICNECLNLINYSFSKLIKCPHDTKPKCRTCATPCYDKNEWKKVAKVMRYSGIKQGLGKIKKFFKNE